MNHIYSSQSHNLIFKNREKNISNMEINLHNTMVKFFSRQGKVNRSIIKIVMPEIMYDISTIFYNVQ
ncbi:hypothetical protein N752_30045 [Desulforamulus aquiferis]|nr:hypothetical protein N752_30045 [Desulforamulus aquiferis]